MPPPLEMCYLGPNKAISIINLIFTSQSHGTMNILHNTALRQLCRLRWACRSRLLLTILISQVLRDLRFKTLPTRHMLTVIMDCKRKQYAIETIYQAIMQVEKGVQKKSVADNFGISASTLSTWLKTKDITKTV